MAERVHRREDLFVLRIWREPGHGEGQGWRGSSEHIASGQRIYFSNFADLADFIRMRLAAPSQEDSGERVRAKEARPCD